MSHPSIRLVEAVFYVFSREKFSHRLTLAVSISLSCHLVLLTLPVWLPLPPAEHSTAVSGHNNNRDLTVRFRSPVKESGPVFIPVPSPQLPMDSLAKGSPGLTEFQSSGRETLSSADSVADTKTTYYYAYEELDKPAEMSEDWALQQPSFLPLVLDTIRVEIELFIDRSGVVRKYNVIKSEPVPMVGEQIAESLMRLHFAPAHLHGLPVNSRKRIEIVIVPAMDSIPQSIPGN